MNRYEDGRVRLGIIGLGNMGSGHFDNIMSGKCPSARLTAVCDIDPQKMDKAHHINEITCFSDHISLLESGLIDAVLIATPHIYHPSIAIDAFERGVHVLTEKPAGVYTRQVREMIDAADRSGLKFGIMFNQRTDPIYKKAHDIIKSGQLGQPKRLVWIITNWYRTQAYYNSGSWRATWRGEGGGVLLNQAPHNLDLWQWMFGMPDSLYAVCDLGKYHNIAVEDDVTITAKYKSGARATFITTTGEAPGTNRLEISGDLGKIVMEDGRLKWWRLHTPERAFCFEAKTGFAMPELDYSEFTADAPDGHATVLETFTRSIIDGSEPIADGREGLNSLKISNAAYLSSILGKEISLNFDEALFEEHLEELRALDCEKGDQVREDVGNIKERWKVRW